MIGQVDFNLIRYANCWEDADILSEALDIPKGGKILSIASAGDNSFSLLLKEPALLVAVDVSEVQLFLVEIKKACIKNLSQPETLRFLGFTNGTDRAELFEKISKDLSPEALAHWRNHFEQIEEGLVHQGKFERYFRMFVKKILPWIHSKKTVNALFREKPAEEQKLFYRKTWNTWRWRLLFKIFFSRWVMGKFGRDPQFLKQVTLKVSEYIFRSAERELSGTHVFQNFILRYNLTAGFGNLLPHYLQPNNYERIKAQIDKLILHQGFAEDAVAIYGTFDAMNLSNIFEYIEAELFGSVVEKLAKGLNKDGKLAYWNLMVHRKASDVLPDEIRELKELSQKLKSKDKGFFYSNFVVEQKS
jgi:S-adenosylmethionine-diacylglycerol 3-amino-3-carboxypropyl transferase